MLITVVPRYNVHQERKEFIPKNRAIAKSALVLLQGLIFDVFVIVLYKIKRQFLNFYKKTNGSNVLKIKVGIERQGMNIAH